MAQSGASDPMSFSRSADDVGLETSLKPIFFRERERKGERDRESDRGRESETEREREELTKLELKNNFSGPWNPRTQGGGTGKEMAYATDRPGQRDLEG